MANKIDIEAAILSSYAYMIELTEELYNEQSKGCFDCYDASKIECLLWLSEDLQNRIDQNILDKDTDILYENLLEVLSGYMGETPSVDPNASIPYTIIIIDGGSGGIAQWGFITGDITEQVDLMALFATKADIGDGIITPVNITIVGNDAIVTAVSGAEITWKIGTTLVTVPSPQTLPINDASDNYFRKDWIAMTLMGLVVVEGTETQTAATPPNLPPNYIGLAVIDVYGGIINSNPPQPPVDISAPSWVVYGSQPFGKYTNGQTVPAAASAYEQYKEAWTNIPHPTYVQPVAVLSSYPSTSGLEIGTTINVDLTLNFSQNDAGAETSRVINKNGVPLGSTADTIVISSTPVVYQGSVSYAQGAVKNNIVGVPDPVGRIDAGTKNSNPITYVGGYKRFYGTGSIPTDSSAVRALPYFTFGNTFTINIAIGQTEIAFGYPASLPDITNTSVKYVEGFNSNVGNIFTKNTFDVEDADTVPVPYKIYTVTLPSAPIAPMTYNVTL